MNKLRDVCPMLLLRDSHGMQDNAALLANMEPGAVARLLLGLVSLVLLGTDLH
jgi:hypothetical protein